MAGIFIFSENNNIALQLLTLGLELKQSMQEQVLAITLRKEEGERLVAAGADKVYVLENDSRWPESYSAAIANLLNDNQAALFIVGATSRGRDIAARVAAHLRTSLVSEAIKIEFVDGVIETQRLMYGGAVVCTEEFHGTGIVSVAPGKYPSQEPATGSSGEIISIDVKVQTGVTIDKVEPVVHRGTDITRATRVVGVGRGVGRIEDIGMIEELAAAIGAELGCTRSIAEEFHWLPNEAYIGISGRNIKPEIYLSVGVSGQIQHVVGIRDSKIIVAVDKAENAPIFNSCDYGIVGDLYEIVPLLTKAIMELK